MSTTIVQDGTTTAEGRRRGAARAVVIGALLLAAVVVLALANPHGPLAFAQAVSDGLRLGLVLSLIGLGLSLVFATSGVFNFAHGEFATLGALVAWWLGSAGVPLVIAILVAVPVGALVGLGSERALWRPLRRRGVNLTSVLVVGIGLGLAVRSLFLFAIGGSSRSYSEYAVQSPMNVLGLSVTPKQLVAELVCVLALVALALFLTRTSVGQSVRAVADDPVLASASGIPVDRTLAIVWTVGGALAALGGGLLGLFEKVSWEMGNQVFLLIIAGVTLGGLGSVVGAAVGSLIVGVLTQVGVLFLPAELKYTTALAILIVILLVRPSGIFGRRQRVG